MWGMNLFMVVSFGKVFRMCFIRRCDEKLLFHVRKYKQRFRVQLIVLD